MWSKVLQREIIRAESLHEKEIQRRARIERTKANEHGRDQRKKKARRKKER